MAVHDLNGPAGTAAPATASAPSADASGTGISVRNLEVSYGNVAALRGVTVDVPAGGYVSVLGANGAGKTTLVRAITGLLGLHAGRVVSGSVTLDGVELTSRSTRDIVKAGIAQVPEGRKLFPTLTVEENLLCGAATRADRGEINDNLTRVYDLFPRVQERRKQTAGYLSGGEQQMVAVGRALMAQPRYLVCDELSLGLAPIIVQQLFDLLNEIVASGVGVLVIEQNARLALQHTHHGYVIEVGRVVIDGPSEELRNDTVVQDLYLGGGGEAAADFADVTKRRRRWRR